jgi:hypothetical protein
MDREIIRLLEITMAKRYDIVVPKKDPRDPNKTYWKNVGSMVKFEATQEKPEGFILELHMFPDTTFKVFEQKPKVAQVDVWGTAVPATPAKAPPSEIEYPTESVNPDDIPF